MSQGTVKWFNSGRALTSSRPNGGGSDAFVHIQAPIKGDSIGPFREGGEFHSNSVTEPQKSSKMSAGRARRSWPDTSASGLVGATFLYWRPGQRRRLSLSDVSCPAPDQGCGACLR